MVHCMMYTGDSSSTACCPKKTTTTATTTATKTAVDRKIEVRKT